MRDHRAKLEVAGIGTWVLNAPRGQAEFIGEHNYVPSVRGNLWKFLEGATQPKFVDPERRFVLLDALDEVIRADAYTGELKTVATVRRAEDSGLRSSKFVAGHLPILVFEHGLVVFRSEGQVLWLRDDLKLKDFFQCVTNDRILYSSEHRGKWAYDLHTGDSVAPELGFENW